MNKRKKKFSPIEDKLKLVSNYINKDTSSIVGDYLIDGISNSYDAGYHAVPELVTNNNEGLLGACESNEIYTFKQLLRKNLSSSKYDGIYWKLMTIAKKYGNYKIIKLLRWKIFLDNIFNIIYILLWCIFAIFIAYTEYKSEEYYNYTTKIYQTNDDMYIINSILI